MACVLIQGYLRHLSAGELRDTTWKANSLLGSELAAFASVVSPERVFVPAASPPPRLHVVPDNLLPRTDVIPVVALIPIFPMVLLPAGPILTIRNRRADLTFGKSQDCRAFHGA